MTPLLPIECKRTMVGLFYAQSDLSLPGLACHFVGLNCLHRLIAFCLILLFSVSLFPITGSYNFVVIHHASMIITLIKDENPEFTSAFEHFFFILRPCLVGN